MYQVWVTNLKGFAYQRCRQTFFMGRLGYIPHIPPCQCHCCLQTCSRNIPTFFYVQLYLIPWKGHFVLWASMNLIGSYIFFMLNNMIFYEKKKVANDVFILMGRYVKNRIISFRVLWSHWKRVYTKIIDTIFTNIFPLIFFLTSSSPFSCTCWVSIAIFLLGPITTEYFRPNHFSAISASKIWPRFRSHNGGSGKQNSNKQPMTLAIPSVSETVFQVKNTANKNSTIVPNPMNTVMVEPNICRWSAGHTSAKYTYIHVPEPKNATLCGSPSTH